MISQAKPSRKRLPGHRRKQQKLTPFSFQPLPSGDSAHPRARYALPNEQAPPNNDTPVQFDPGKQELLDDPKIE